MTLHQCDRAEDEILDLKRQIKELEATLQDESENTKPRFENTYCSQCGSEFGPDDPGYSYCIYCVETIK